MFDMSRFVQILSGSIASENCRPTKTVACRNVNCHHFILVTGLWWNVIRFPSSQSVHQSETNGWTEAVMWRFSTDPVITLNAAKTAHGVVGLRRRTGNTTQSPVVSSSLVCVRLLNSVFSLLSLLAFTSQNYHFQGVRAIKRRVNVNATRIMGVWWAVLKILLPVSTCYMLLLFIYPSTL